MATINVKDANGTTQIIAKIPTTGPSNPAVDSLPIVQPTDAAAWRVHDSTSKTALDALLVKLAGALSTDGLPLKQLIDEASSTTTYICEALPGTAPSAPAWRVQRIISSGSVTIVSYAGTGAFDQVADNRASLSY